MNNNYRRLQDLLLIHPGESGKTAYFLLFFLLVSTGMSIGSGTAHALFLKRIGIHYLPLMYMVQSILLALVSLGYAAVADRLPAERTFRSIFLALLILVAGCWVLIHLSDGSAVFPVYYMIYDVSSDILLVHAALYLNQNMNTLQVKRLAPLMYAGAQAGHITGGLLLTVATPVTGTANMLLVWCALLLAGIAVLQIRHRRHGTSTHFRAPHRSGWQLAKSVQQVQQGIRYTFKSTLLLAASWALFFMVISFYVICYSVNRIYSSSFPSEAELTGFFGGLSAATGAVALVLQLFVAGRAIEHFGIRRMNLLFPVTTLAVLSALTFSYTLPAALIGSINKDALMPAFRNPIRTMFFNVLPANIQGRARAVAIAIVMPAAMMICGLLLWTMQRAGSPVYLLAPGLIAACLYIWFSLRMNRAYIGTLVNTLRERLFLPGEREYRELGGPGNAVFEEIRRGATHADPEVAVSYARVLVESFPDRAAAIILERAAAADIPTADRLLQLLAGTDLSGQEYRLRILLEHGDAHLKASIIRLSAGMPLPSLHDSALQWLEDDNPRLTAAAIHLVMRQAPDGAEQPGRVSTAWIRLLQGDRKSGVAAMGLIEDLRHLPSPARGDVASALLVRLPQLLAEGPDETRQAVLDGLRHWTGTLPPELPDWIREYLESDNPRLRAAATRCLYLLDGEQRVALFQQALGDGHAKVQQAAVECLRASGVDFAKLIPEWLANGRLSLRAQQVLLEGELAAALPANVLSEIAMEKGREAARLSQAIQRLENRQDSTPGASQRLLAHLLRERLERTIHLVLQALEPLYEPGLIAVIRAGFSSADERHIANAGEALSSLERTGPAGLLHDVLLRSRMLNSSPDTGTFHKTVDVLRWAAGLQEEWPRSCALRALQDHQAGILHA